MTSFKVILIIFIGFAIQCDDAMAFRDKRDVENNQCGLRLQSRGFVVGGDVFKRGDFPWMVALMYKSDDKPPSYFCAGTLLSALHVLTAGHCVNPKSDESQFVKLLPRNVLILLGAHNLSNPYEVGRVSMSPSKILLHEDWNPHTINYDADLALMVMDHNVQSTRYIQPICLWQTSPDPSQQEGTVGGWGQSEDKSKYSEPIPTKITVQLHNNENCFLKYPEMAQISSTRTFCGGTLNGTGVCFGDSGAGLFVKQGNIFFLRGIVSSSFVDEGICDVARYAVYTNVLKYNEWIAKIISGTDVSNNALKPSMFDIDDGPELQTLNELNDDVKTSQSTDFLGTLMSSFVRPFNATAQYIDPEAVSRAGSEIHQKKQDFIFGNAKKLLRKFF